MQHIELQGISIQNNVKNFYKLIRKRTSCIEKNGQRNKQAVSRGRNSDDLQIWEKMFKSIVIQKMKVKTTIKYPSIPIISAKMLQSNNITNQIYALLFECRLA